MGKAEITATHWFATSILKTITKLYIDGLWSSLKEKTDFVHAQLRNATFSLEINNRAFALYMRGPGFDAQHYKPPLRC